MKPKTSIHLAPPQIPKRFARHVLQHVAQVGLQLQLLRRESLTLHPNHAHVTALHNVCARSAPPNIPVAAYRPRNPSPCSRRVFRYRTRESSKAKDILSSVYWGYHMFYDDDKKYRKGLLSSENFKR